MKPAPPPLPRTVAPASARHARLSHLDRVVERVLGGPGTRPHPPTEDLLDAWLADNGPDWLPHSAASLAARLVLPASRSDTLQDPAKLERTFAQVLMATAEAEVGREAHRAGHGDAFERLRPWLARTPPESPPPAFGDAAARVAIEPLRRRFRQRVAAGIALWSSTPERARELRHRLHAALSATGETP